MTAKAVLVVCEIVSEGAAGSGVKTEESACCFPNEHRPENTARSFTA